MQTRVHREDAGRSAKASSHASRLSLERIEHARTRIHPAFLDTPQFASDSLSDQLRVEVVLKVETINPIRSFKGRGAEFFVSELNADAPTLVCASAGNFGQGLAYAACRRGVSVIVFAAKNANPLKLDRMRRLGATVRLCGQDFDAAKREARAFSDTTASCFVEDGREPAISEGAGTIAIELCRLPRPLDFVLVPVGNGALIAGLGLWMKSRSPTTRIIGVCATGAPAMALSVNRGTVQETESISTIADGIAVRIPVGDALLDMQHVVDDVLLVDDGAMVEAMRLIVRHHGLAVEPAGAASVAALLEHTARFRGSRVAAVLSGGNLTMEQMRDWLW